MAFTPNVWISTSSTDWATTSNWSLAHIPTTSEDPVFDGTGTADCTTNVDRTADGAFGSDRRFVVTPNHTAAVGSSGSPVIMNFAGNATLKSGGSECWFEVVTSTAARVIASPAQHSSNACQLDGSIADLIVGSGYVQVASSATITDNLIMINDPAVGGTPLCVVASGATVTGSIAQVHAGELQATAAWPDMVIGPNGYYVHKGGTAALIHCMGRIRPEGGTLSEIHMYGARAHFDGTHKSNTVTLMIAGSGATLDFRNHAGVEPATLKLIDPVTVWRDSGE